MIAPVTAPPRSVRLAIILMAVAATASLIQAVLILTQWDSLIANSLRSAADNTVTGPLLAVLGADVGAGYGVAIGLLGLVMWSWTAWATGKGRRWARTVATVLGGLAVLGFLVGLLPHWPVVVRIPAVVVPVAAVAAVVLLHRRDWSSFSAPQGQPG